MFEIIREYIRQAVVDSVEEYESKDSLGFHSDDVALHIIATLKNAGFSITKDSNFSNGDARRTEETDPTDWDDD